MKEKIKITPTEIQEVIIPYSDAMVMVNPIIKIEDQVTLKNNFITSFFENGRWSDQLAEFYFRMSILATQTNIDLEVLGTEDIDKIIWGEFFKKIQSSIINYNEVRLGCNASLQHAIQKLEIESNAGHILKDIMEKASSLLDDLKGFTSQDVEALKKGAEEILEKMKQEPVASILSDANGNKSKRKSKRTKSEKVEKEYVH